MTVPLVIDVILAGLLVATIVYAALLTRRLSRLKSDQAGFVVLTAQLDEATSRAVAGVEMRVVDAQGNTLAPGELGEIVTRGDHLLIEYFDEPEQTADLYKSGGGWLWTGDLGFVDDEDVDLLDWRAFQVAYTGSP